jgi:hypothetical protein
MMDQDLGDVKRSLERLVPRGVPPDLGRRVVGRALEARKNAAMTPRMRIIAAVCAVLIGAVLGADPLLGRRESARIAALLGGPGVSPPVGEDVRLLWAEVGGDLGDLDKFLGERVVLSRLGSRGGAGRAYFEVQDRLKGMIDHEDPENYH